MKKLLLSIAALFMAACMQTLPAVKLAEESMVQDCERIATLSESTDPGRVLDHYRPSEHQDVILQRAANLGATHIVWLYDYRIGSAGVAYRCEN